MKVGIDQEMCTGDGLCEELCPAMFVLCDDGLAYVREDGVVLQGRGGSHQMAEVPPDLEDAVAEAERECPGECIHVEAA